MCPGLIIHKCRQRWRIRQQRFRPFVFAIQNTEGVRLQEAAAVIIELIGFRAEIINEGITIAFSGSSIAECVELQVYIIRNTQ